MYTVSFYEGDYPERQRRANEAGCAAYVEHHFNSCLDSPGDYAVVVTSFNASQTSRNWGRWYAQAVAREFGIPVGGDQGIKVGGYNGHGDFNLRFTRMPAILLEPLFGSNPVHVRWIRSEEGQDRLARILAESIHRFFPDEGHPESIRIAFSVGHKGKTSRPNDRGAAVLGGGWEANFAEAVLHKAETLLQVPAPPAEIREVRVMSGARLLFTQAVDPDAEITWDGIRGLLQIREADGAETPSPP